MKEIQTNISLQYFIKGNMLAPLHRIGRGVINPARLSITATQF